MRTTTLLLALLAACAAPVHAFTSNTGGASAQFLRVGVGARALGMGEAYGPIAEGAESLYWNPAGSAMLQGPDLAYSHSESMTFFHHDYLAYAHPVRLLRGTLGVSGAFFYQDSLGAVDNTNTAVGSFAPHSEVVTLSYARAFDIDDEALSRDREYFGPMWNHPGAVRPLYPEEDLWHGRLAFGFAGKYVKETLYRRSASALALDGGILYRHHDYERFHASLVFRNLGTTMRFIQESEKLPLELAAGLSYDARFSADRRVLLAVEAAQPYYGPPYGKVGAEYSAPVSDRYTMAFRMGYKTVSLGELSPLAGLTAGVGVGTQRLSLDFGFQLLGDLGESYRLGANIRF